MVSGLSTIVTSIRFLLRPARCVLTFACGGGGGGGGHVLVCVCVCGYAKCRRERQDESGVCVYCRDLVGDRAGPKGRVSARCWMNVGYNPPVGLLWRREYHQTGVSRVVCDLQTLHAVNRFTPLSPHTHTRNGAAHHAPHGDITIIVLYREADF